MSMMDDIEKYSKMWDDAKAAGIFAEAPKPPAPAEPTDSADYFGNFLGGNYDIDKPLNEVDVTYWNRLSKMAGGSLDPLREDKAQETEVAKAMGNAANPIYPYSYGKDQEMKVNQNWGAGGKEIEQLAELKAKLENLEGKITATEVNGGGTKNIQQEIDSLRKQIDELSDSLHDRWS